MTADTDFLNLFSTPVWVADLEPSMRDRVNADILNNLEDLVGTRPVAAAAGGMPRPDADIHAMPAFAGLFVRCAAGVEAILDFLKGDQADFEFMGSRLHVEPPGGSSAPAMHSGNGLCGVYYVQTGKEADGIVFGDPRSRGPAAAPPDRRQAICAGDEASIEAREGRIVIFPAWLPYVVPVNGSDRDRISLAFDVNVRERPEARTAPRPEAAAQQQTGRAPTRITGPAVITKP